MGEYSSTRKRSHFESAKLADNFKSEKFSRLRKGERQHGWWAEHPDWQGEADPLQVQTSWHQCEEQGPHCVRPAAFQQEDLWLSMQQNALQSGHVDQLAGWPGKQTENEGPKAPCLRSCAGGMAYSGALSPTQIPTTTISHPHFIFSSFIANTQSFSLAKFPPSPLYLVHWVIFFLQP